MVLLKRHDCEGVALTFVIDINNAKVIGANEYRFCDHLCPCRRATIMMGWISKTTLDHKKTQTSGRGSTWRAECLVGKIGGLCRRRWFPSSLWKGVSGGTFWLWVSFWGWLCQEMMVWRMPVTAGEKWMTHTGTCCNWNRGSCCRWRGKGKLDWVLSQF